MRGLFRQKDPKKRKEKIWREKEGQASGSSLTINKDPEPINYGGSICTVRGMRNYAPHPKCVILPHHAYFSYLHRWRNLFAAAAEYVVIIIRFCPKTRHALIDILMDVTFG